MQAFYYCNISLITLPKLLLFVPVFSKYFNISIFETFIFSIFVTLSWSSLGICEYWILSAFISRPTLLLLSNGDFFVDLPPRILHQNWHYYGKGTGVFYSVPIPLIFLAPLSAHAYADIPVVPVFNLQFHSCSF